MIISKGSTFERILSELLKIVQLKVSVHGLYRKENIRHKFLIKSNVRFQSKKWAVCI